MTIQATKKELICQWFALDLAQDSVCNESNGLQPCLWHGWLHAHAQPQNHGIPLNIHVRKPHVSHGNSTVKCPSSSPELAPFQWPGLASWHCRCLDDLHVVVTCLFGDLHNQSPNSRIVLLLDIGPVHCPCDAYLLGSDLLLNLLLCLLFSLLIALCSNMHDQTLSVQGHEWELGVRLVT